MPVVVKSIPKTKSLGNLVFDKPHTITTREIETLEILRRFGDKVKHISPSNRPNAKTPDVEWRDELWEIKTISGATRNNIHHAIQSAKAQSPNIIIHIPKTKRQQDAILRDLESTLFRLRGIRQILVLINDRYCYLKRNTVK